jgi:hypothetical protein
MSRRSPHEVSHPPDDHFYAVKVIMAHRCGQRRSLGSINDQGLHRPEQGLNRLTIISSGPLISSTPRLTAL